MRKTRYVYFLSGLLFQADVGFALQTHPLVDHHKLEISISTKELNRIAIAGDRILHVVGAEGALDVQSDDDTGQIFVRCLRKDQNNPSVLTIITESGLTQDLKLIPESCEFQSILLRPQAVSNDAEEKLLLKSTYTQKLTGLMQAMAAGHRMERYTLSALHKEDRTYPEPLTVTPLVTYQRETDDGNTTFFEGRIYRLKNEGDEALPLSEQVLALPSDCALALTKHTLQPGDEGFLFVISKARGSL